MKKQDAILFGICAVVFLFYLAAVSPAAADIALVNSSRNGLTVSYRPGIPVVDTIRTDETTYIAYKYENHSLGNESGKPAIPAEHLFFAAPDGAAPLIELSEHDISIQTNVVIAPLPIDIPDENGFATFEYREDPLSYALSGYNPNSYASLGRKIVIDGIAVWELILRPLLFDADNKSVAVTDGFDVTVSFNSAGSEISERLPEYVINRDAFAGSSVFKTADTAESPFASGEWYKIKLRKNGMYRVSGSELEDAGFPIGTVSTNNIHVYYGGGIVLTKIPYEITTESFREIAVRVDDGGDGVFDAADKIVFYGESISRFILDQDTTRPEYQNYPYADENLGQNAYWIYIDDTGTPKRIQTTGEVPSSSLTAIKNSTGYLHIEQENYLEWIDSYNYESGVEWYWDTITQSGQFMFDAPLLAPGEPSVLRVGFKSGSKKDERDRIELIHKHTIDITVNNGAVNRNNINTESDRYIEIALGDELNADSNKLSIWRVGSNYDDNVRLDWIELEYKKALSFGSEKNEYYMTGTAGKEKFEISQLLNSTVEIYNTTDPYNVSRITATLYNSTNNTMTFQTDIDENKLERFTLSSPYSYLSVDSITKKTNSNLRSVQSGGNYIIVTHEDFHSQAVTLANFRSKDSATDPLSTMVVDVGDLYDEFSWGVFDPSAIRDFLKYAHESYTDQLRFCCLIGDAISKFKNLSEKQQGSTFVPTFTEVFEEKGLVTDDYFAWFDTNRSPYLAIGRLCVNNSDEAKVAVNKIIKYERDPEPGIWRNRILWIADDELGYQGEIKTSNDAFTRDTEDIDSNGYVPHYYERKKIYLIEYPLKGFRKPEATEEIIESLNDGFLISNYIGHGNSDVLSHEYALRGSRDIELLNNEGRQSLMLAFSCSVGQFDKPETISLAELLNLRKDGGCIAVIAATRITYNFKNVISSKAYFENLFDSNTNSDHRIGVALKMVKQRYSTDENSNRYVLFGDPATHLMMPQYRFNTAAIDTLYRLEKLDILGSVTNQSETVPYEGTLYINAQGPKIHKNYTNGGVDIDYSMPGKTFYKGEVDIAGDSFDAGLVAPLDLQSDISDSNEFQRESKIYLFASGGVEEATGVIENFYIGGVIPDAPEDNTPPDITVSFDGNEFDEGDYIRRQPAMTITIRDDSGINILGNRGHNINLLIDKTESIVLTNNLKTVNGYTEGTIEYALPVQSLGEHTFQVSAYDNYNNSAKKVIQTQVVGSESGDVTITDLLNYPNPMGTYGTTFTFNLNDDARSADIKIYSQSGRLVDTARFSAAYGFNQVYWKPPVVLANGVYFYKLNILSMNGRKTSKIEKLVVMR